MLILFTDTLPFIVKIKYYDSMVHIGDHRTSFLLHNEKKMQYLFAQLNKESTISLGHSMRIASRRSKDISQCFAR